MGLLQTVQHPDALLVTVPTTGENLFGKGLFQPGDVEMMNGLGSLSSATIHTLDLVAHMSIVILLRQLSWSAIR